MLEESRDPCHLFVPYRFAHQPYPMLMPRPVDETEAHGNGAHAQGTDQVGETLTLP